MAPEAFFVKVDFVWAGRSGQFPLPTWRSAPCDGTIPPSIAKSIRHPEGAFMDASLEHAIDLDPVDWFWAPWRRRPPLLRPEPKPFDFPACVARLERAKVGRQKRW